MLAAGQKVVTQSEFEGVLKIAKWGAGRFRWTEIGVTEISTGTLLIRQRHRARHAASVPDAGVERVQRECTGQDQTTASGASHALAKSLTPKRTHFYTFLASNPCCTCAISYQIESKFIV